MTNEQDQAIKEGQEGSSLETGAQYQTEMALYPVHRIDEALSKA